MPETANKPGRILLLQWSGSAYDSLRGFLRLAGEEFAADGHEVHTVVIDHPGWQDKLNAAVGGGALFALGMSGVGADLTTGDKHLLWEAVKIPFFDWNCDHPCYFPNRHAIRNRYLLHGYVFPDHARYAMRHFNANGSACFLHMGIPPRRIFAGAPLPARARNGRIVFTKSGADTNSIEARWRSFVPPLRELVFAAAEELYHRSTADFLEVLGRLAEPHGLLLDGNSELTLNLIREVDTYVRFRRASLVVDAVLRYPVDVYGTGWEHIDWSGGSAAYKGPADWNRMTTLLPGYLGCLSTNPLIDESVHDRSFFALAANVVPVADSNAFSRRHMAGLERYAFRFEPQSIRAAVEALLAGPEQALEHTEAAWRALDPVFAMRESLRRLAVYARMVATNARCAP